MIFQTRGGSPLNQKMYELLLKLEENIFEDLNLMPSEFKKEMYGKASALIEIPIEKADDDDYVKTHVEEAEKGLMDLFKEKKTYKISELNVLRADNPSNKSFGYSIFFKTGPIVASGTVSSNTSASGTFSSNNSITFSMGDIVANTRICESEKQETVRDEQERSVLIFGAGKIGSAIVDLFLEATAPAYKVHVADVKEKLFSLQAHANLIKIPINPESISYDAIVEQSKCKAIISACPFSVNKTISTLAWEHRVSYFDLTEDIATTEYINGIAILAKPGQIFMPQCGLAPGFVGIVGHSMAMEFDKIDEIKMRVGALPKCPSNDLMYNLTWSTDGLINEYCNPCDAIVNWKAEKTTPLEGLERLSVDGVEYEAFNTSGGLGTLCETLAGKVRSMDYKTIRYPGHRYLMNFLINGLRLSENRELLKTVLEKAIPITVQDVVFTFVTVSGWKKGEFVQLTDARKIYGTNSKSAIQLTTSVGLCTAVDMFFNGQLQNKGFVSQEKIHLKDFLKNRFGKKYTTAS